MIDYFAWKAFLNSSSTSLILKIISRKQDEHKVLLAWHETNLSSYRQTILIFLYRCNETRCSVRYYPLPAICSYKHPSVAQYTQCAEQYVWSCSSSNLISGRFDAIGEPHTLQVVEAGRNLAHLPVYSSFFKSVDNKIFNVSYHDVLLFQD